MPIQSVKIKSGFLLNEIRQNPIMGYGIDAIICLYDYCYFKKDIEVLSEALSIVKTKENKLKSMSDF